MLPLSEFLDLFWVALYSFFMGMAPWLILLGGLILITFFMYGSIVLALSVLSKLKLLLRKLRKWSWGERVPEEAGG